MFTTASVATIGIRRRRGVLGNVLACNMRSVGWIWRIGNRAIAIARLRVGSLASEWWRRWLVTSKFGMVIRVQGRV
jgi:hypothetical protein